MSDSWVPHFWPILPEVGIFNSTVLFAITDEPRGPPFFAGMIYRDTI